MEIKYDSKTDAMYIRLNNKSVVTSKSVADGSVVVDIADDGTAVGIELISPSRYTLNLEEIIYLVDDQR